VHTCAVGRIDGRLLAYQKRRAPDKARPFNLTFIDFSQHAIEGQDPYHSLRQKNVPIE
jgi:hypothetical protein